MAENRKKQHLRESSSSEEDEEALQRMREAAWNPSIGVAANRPPPSEETSLRRTVNLHGDDGNELQTTAEFRAHVAKKLAAILDSSIATLERPPRTAQNDGEGSDTEDDGFRLFSSSLPGDAGETKCPPSSARKTWRKRSDSSSSSDEEWRRCREAAVTAADVLKTSALPGAIEDATEDDPRPIAQLGKEKKNKKKKKRKKMAACENGGEECAA